MKYWSISAARTIEELSSNPDYGLNKQQVNDLIAAHGPNEYQQSKPESVPSMVLRQFKDVANLILLLAAGLSLALAVREGHGYVEPAVILAVITLLPIVIVILLVTPQAVAGLKILDGLRDSGWLHSPEAQAWFASLDEWLKS